MPPRFPLIMWLPPPLYYAVTFLVAFGIQTLTPLKGFAFPSPVVLVGLVVLAGGLFCALGSVFLFMSQRTTLVPHGTPKRLVVSGAYRFTRNPMYLGLALVFVGLALRFNGVVPLLSLPLPVLLLDRVVIPFEQAHLRRTWPIEFSEYCSRVRRWI